MTRRTSVLAACLLLTGCASGPPAAPTGVSSSPTPSAASSASPDVAQASHEANAEPLLQPMNVQEPIPAPTSETPRPLPGAGPLDASSLEAMAVANNPALAEAAARVRALKGKWVQVGLPPNPTVGYVAGEIGNEGNAGQQGGFAGQQFITGGKLQRNRDVVAAEILRAEQDLAAMDRRVRTDVRQAYYEAMLAQRRIALAEELVRVSEEAVTASKSLVEAEEIPVAGLLQTEIQQQNAQVLLRTAGNQQQQAWRRLAAVVGEPGLSPRPLEGEVEELPGPLGWDEQLIRLQTESPEVAAAMAEVERARRSLARACVEPLPNINTQVSVQYDDSTEDTIAGVQIGLPLPLWNLQPRRHPPGAGRGDRRPTPSRSCRTRLKPTLGRGLSRVLRRASHCANLRRRDSPTLRTHLRAREERLPAWRGRLPRTPRGPACLRADQPRLPGRPAVDVGQLRADRWPAA